MPALRLGPSPAASGELREWRGAPSLGAMDVAGAHDPAVPDHFSILSLVVLIGAPLRRGRTPHHRYRPAARLPPNASAPAVPHPSRPCCPAFRARPGRCSNLADSAVLSATRLPVIGRNPTEQQEVRRRLRLPLAEVIAPEGAAAPWLAAPRRGAGWWLPAPTPTSTLEKFRDDRRARHRSHHSSQPPGAAQVFTSTVNFGIRFQPSAPDRQRSRDLEISRTVSHATRLRSPSPRTRRAEGTPRPRCRPGRSR